MVNCGGWSDWKKSKREQWVQWTGSIRNEFPEMATHGWAELAWIWELEGGGLRGSCTSSWTEGERQKDDREYERERPPGVDRCSPPLQLRPHSWPGSLDIFLCTYVSLPRFLPHHPPPSTHMMTSCSMLHDVQYSSLNMASLPTKLQHSHNSKWKTSCLRKGLSLMHLSCILLQIITSWLICSRSIKYTTVAPNKAVRFLQGEWEGVKLTHSNSSEEKQVDSGAATEHMESEKRFFGLIHTQDIVFNNFDLQDN